MRVLIASSEAVPFAKTGGLADYTTGLARALAAKGLDAAIVIPYYRAVRESGLPTTDLGHRFSFAMDNETHEGAVYGASLPAADVPVYFVRHDGFFDRDGLYGQWGNDFGDNAKRFAFFSRAVIEVILALGLDTDLLHLNDWQTSLSAVYLNSLYASRRGLSKLRTLLTMHNLMFQGLFGPEMMRATGLPAELFHWQGLEFYGKLGFLKGGMVFADWLSTVSPTYAKEIQSSEFAYGLEGVVRERADRVVGILNGIDSAEWDPRHDPWIPTRYSPSDPSGKTRCREALWKNLRLAGSGKEPLIAMITRLDSQKGLDLVAETIDRILALPARFVLLGTGDPWYHHVFGELAARRNGDVAVALRFDNQLAHQIEAGADMLLMPSRYEPCGLTQMHSLLYGTIPLARSTGGLADTVLDASDERLASGLGNGFAFQEYSASALLSCVERAAKTFADKRRWNALVRRAMTEDHSWDAAAEEYLKLYAKILEAQR
ncbi:MAG: glycogen synthase GlgA [Planctomycetota bacterium]